MGLEEFFFLSWTLSLPLRVSTSFPLPASWWESFEQEGLGPPLAAQTLGWLIQGERS